MAQIFGGGVWGFGRVEKCPGCCEEEGEDGVAEEVAESWVLDLGAKNREITCCFCFPMTGEFLNLKGSVKPRENL